MHSFLMTLANCRKGGLLVDAADAVEKVVRAVEATGKAGDITIKLKIAPLGRDSAAVSLSDSISAKVPKHDSASIFYPTDTGELVREDPHQPDLPLRPVPASKEASNG